MPQEECKEKILSEEYRDFMITVCGTKNITPKSSSISNIRISLYI